MTVHKAYARWHDSQRGWIRSQQEAFAAGYRAAQRAHREAERRSRVECSAAEATIAAQVAAGGDAGERATCDALENAEAAGRLLEAVETAKAKPGRRSRAA